MEKKKGNKFLKIFKKEGFYVILFVCLCIVASVAALTARNSKKLQTKPPLAQNKINSANKISSSSKTKHESDQINNALEIKERRAKTQKNNTTASQETGKNVNTAASVSSSTDTAFTNPVKGTLAIGYSPDVPVVVDLNGDVRRTLRGITIAAKIGDPVVAANSGQVEDVSFGNFGETVTIKHDNGMRTVYGNLSEKINVSKGQRVLKGQQIGALGDTTTEFSKYEKPFKDCLIFQVFKDKENDINPLKYVKY